MSARSPIERGDEPFFSVPTTPVPPRPRVTSMPQCGEPAGDDVGSALFLEAQFRMGVKVAPDLLDFGAELNHAVDQLHDGSA